MPDTTLFAVRARMETALCPVMNARVRVRVRVRVTWARITFGLDSISYTPTVVICASYMQ